MLEKKRFPHIDLLETIAIFSVIFCHCGLYDYDFLQDGSFINYARYFLRTFVSPCIPIFFFVNGYLLFNRDFDLKKHIKKTLRLVAIFFFWAVILIPLYMLISGKPFSIKTVIYGALYLDRDWQMNVFWFIGAMVCLYILFPALKALFDKSKKGFIFFIAACFLLTFGFVLGSLLSALIGSVVGIAFRDAYMPALIMFNPFHGACGYSYVYFCIGGLVYTYEDRILSIKRYVRNIVSVIGLLLSSACLFLAGIFYSKHGSGEVWDVIWNGFDTVFIFASVMFIYVLSLNYKRNNSFVKNVSINTMGIYLTHYLFINLTKPLLMKHSAFCTMSVNTVYAFAVMCASLLLCLLLRKIPFIKKML